MNTTTTQLVTLAHIEPTAPEQLENDGPNYGIQYTFKDTIKIWLWRRSASGSFHIYRTAPPRLFIYDHSLALTNNDCRILDRTFTSDTDSLLASLVLHCLAHPEEYAPLIDHLLELEILK